MLDGQYPASCRHYAWLASSWRDGADKYKDPLQKEQRSSQEHQFGFILPRGGGGGGEWQNHTANISTNNNFFRITDIRS